MHLLCKNIGVKTVKTENNGATTRDLRGRFLPGGSGGPGRPRAAPRVSPISQVLTGLDLMLLENALRSQAEYLELQRQSMDPVLFERLKTIVDASNARISLPN